MHRPRHDQRRGRGALTPTLDRWLAKKFAPHRLDELLAELATAQDGGPGKAAEEAQQVIVECDRKLRRHRLALEALGSDGDPALIAGWIAETQAERKAAEARLRSAPSKPELSTGMIKKMINEIGDVLKAIVEADPQDKAELYGKLGLKLTYRPQEQKVRAELALNPHSIGERYVSEVR